MTPRSSAQPVSMCSARVGSSTSSTSRSPVATDGAAGQRSRAATRRRPPGSAKRICGRPPRAERGGRPIATISPAAHHGHPVGERLRLVHVVRRQQDRSCRPLRGRAIESQAARRAPGRSRWWARPGTAAPGRRPAPARGRAGAAARRTGSARGVAPRRPGRRAASTSPTGRGVRVVAGEQRDGLARRVRYG